MSARDKASAAKLRGIPDEVFAAEARRRGFEPYNGRTWVVTRELDAQVGRLEAAAEAVLDGGDQLQAIRAVRGVARSLRGYLELTEALDPAHRGGAT